jgi:hypothetical protein
VTGGSTQQSQMRLPNCLTSRSEGRSQGRPQPAFIVRESLRACRSEGSSCDRSGLIQLAARVRFDGGNSTHPLGQHPRDNAFAYNPASDADFTGP